MIKAIPRVGPKYESDNKFVWSVMSAIYQEKIDRCIFPISETKVRAREKRNSMASWCQLFIRRRKWPIIPISQQSVWFCVNGPKYACKETFVWRVVHFSYLSGEEGDTRPCRIMKKNGWDASGGGATSYFSAIVLHTNTHTNPNPNTNTNTNTNLHIFGNCFTNKQKLRKTKGIVSTSKGQREWIWKVALWISYIKW